jgi:hypothetical protein
MERGGKQRAHTGTGAVYRIVVRDELSERYTAAFEGMVIFLTASKPVKLSASFIAGVAIATTVGVAIALAIISLLGSSVSLGDSSDNGSTGHIIQYLLVGLLIALAVKNYLGRETVEPPSWLGTLQSADSKKALTTGLLVILLMPSDLIIMLTEG